MAKRLTHSAEELDAAIAKANENSEDIAELQTAVSGKADKLEGKQLSTNDYTDEDKAKLSELENYDDTALRESVAAAAEQAALNRSALGYQRKNLLKNTAVSQTINGVTFTVNADGSVTVNGTATANAGLLLSEVFTIPAGKYLLSGCTGGANGSYRINLQNISTASNYNGNTSIELSDDTATQGRVFVQSGNTVENLTFYPMLRHADITDDTYEPYKPSVEERLVALEEKIAALEGGGA